MYFSCRNGTELVMLVLEWLPHKECEPEIWIRMSGSRSLVTAIPGNADRIHRRNQ